MRYQVFTPRLVPQLHSEVKLVCIFCYNWAMSSLEAIEYKGSCKCPDAAILGVIIIVSFWSVTDISVTLIPRCFWNFRLKKYKPEPRSFDTFDISRKDVRLMIRYPSKNYPLLSTRLLNYSSSITNPKFINHFDATHHNNPTMLFGKW